MRFMIFLAGAAMAASYFVTWVEPPFAGQEISPSVLIGTDLQAIITDGTWQARVFVGGFVLAALCALLGALGRTAGLVALLAGASPVVLLVHYYLRAEDVQADLGLPFSVNFQDLGQVYELLGDFLRAGLWMYAGGAAVLLLAGMSVTFGRR
ncbi:hypothetical protein [Jannaschia sp. CCS1]|uniref:hypothetical protein n=1 Tax=Jannaschia sp. (strain CCS1) TaxID=290400 RepID=UPI000053DAB2|nr:hypothetical protein [Jannaschia sp. CCS1]ABD54625.1 hypothetical protein Jann_1708 [Jannaschia sp. CCS1]